MFNAAALMLMLHIHVCYCCRSVNEVLLNDIIGYNVTFVVVFVVLVGYANYCCVTILLHLVMHD